MSQTRLRMPMEMEDAMEETKEKGSCCNEQEKTKCCCKETQETSNEECCCKEGECCNDEGKCDCEEEGCQPTKTKEEQLQEEIELLQTQLQEVQNNYYKAYADTENLKKRLQADTDMIRKYRIQSFAQDILPVLDNLSRAIQFETEDEIVKKHIDGTTMIYQQLKTALEKEGVVEIECINEPFDPNFHQALVMEKKEGVKSGIVLEELQKGYKLKDRIIRASLVKVSE